MVVSQHQRLVYLFCSPPECQQACREMIVEVSRLASGRRRQKLYTSISLVICGRYRTSLPKKVTSNSTELGIWIATRLPPCAFMCCPIALISLDSFAKLYSTVFSFPYVVITLPFSPPVGLPSESTGPASARFHTSLKSPSLPLVHFGWSAFLTFKPDLRG